MRIGIDGTPLALPFHDGTRHYAEQLLTALVALDRRNEYVIFSPPFQPFAPEKNVRIVTIPQHIPILKRQFFLPSAVAREHVDIFHYLEPFGAYVFRHRRIVSTVHDLNLNIVYSGLRSPQFLIRKYYSSLIRAGALKNTNIFIAVSEYTKRELKEYLSGTHLEQPVVVIPEAPHRAFRTLQHMNTHREDYFLCMGDFSPRKNIPRVMEAYAALPSRLKRNYRLKIVISTDIPKKDIIWTMTKYKLSPYIDILQNITLNQLVRLYNNARAFLYVSLYEGFGLPILEAMACGCPVITSDRSATRETAGGAAFLVNPEATGEITQAMRAIIEISHLSEILHAKGFVRARQFSWERTAQQTLAVYERIYRSP